jgi:hypothetical protein
MSKDPGYSDSKVDTTESRNRSLQRENQKLREALKFTILAAEHLYQPHRPLQKDLCPTFYFTLSYEGDLELIQKTKEARKLLDEE